MVPESLSTHYLAHVRARFARCCEILEQQGFDGLLIAAGEMRQPFRDDVHYPFKVNPDFKAWLPLLDRPGSYLWLSPQRDCPQLFYHQPQDIWHRVQPFADETVASAMTVEVLADNSNLHRQLPAAGRLAFIGEPDACPPSLVDRIELNPDKLLTLLDYERAWKSDYEVGCLRLASERAISGHRAAAECFRSGGSEYDIHLAYLQASRQLDEELPYGNIIALNEHAAILHYTQRERQPPTQLRSFLIDAGASVAGYHADISRTWPAVNDDFAALIEAMDQLQQSLVRSIRPGEPFLQLHLRAHQQLAELLYQLGLLRCPPAEALEQRLTQVFFPHGLGHLLGLQVHDRGGWLQSPDGREQPPPAEHPWLRLTRPLEAGMVFTIEPGLYFIPALLEPLRQQPAGRHIHWPAVDALLPYGGIRIEDNIHIAGDGVYNLTREQWEH